MYSESDLALAVEEGVLSPEAAEAFRNHIAARNSTPIADEESFRLLTGFNDIFVGIATVLILVAVGWIGAYIAGQVVRHNTGPVEVGIVAASGSFAVAITSWLLAEYFTRQRRMALPSILLLLGFAGGVLFGFAGIFGANIPWLWEQANAVTDDQKSQLVGGVAAIVGVLTALATWIHWRRFMVPITVAVGAVTAVGIAVGLIIAFVPGAKDWINPIVLVAGLIVFSVAMAWDMSDLQRHTRRADVAFWLHLAAAPLIAHPVFHMLGVFDGDISVPMAGVVIALYVGFALLALAVDRRALLVSSLIYVLWAMYALFESTGAVELSAALTGLVIGSALLMLSAFWQPMRRGVVGLLGGLGDSLPPTQHPALA
ncbi:MAG: hypothetical protein V4574_00915 [Pseudomonadota bacterium]